MSSHTSYLSQTVLSVEKISVTWRNVRCNLILVMYILGPGEELSQKSGLSVEKCDKYEIWLRNEDTDDEKTILREMMEREKE